MSPVNRETAHASRRVHLSACHESVEPFAYADGDDLVVRLRLAAGAARRVTVHHCDKFAPGETETRVDADRFARSGPDHILYQARLVRDTKRFKYFFHVRVPDGSQYVSRLGVTETRPGWDDAFEVPYLGERDRFAPPDWTRGPVYYQIFPDRFYRLSQGQTGDSQELADWHSVPTPTAVFGGNLGGIVEKLDHLAALGVEALYMTPIFTAPSNHKYDTADYFQIDPGFGTLEDLRALVAGCHARGIRVVLDAVFNHMGAQHPVFQDLLVRGEESPYRDWIHAKSWPLSKAARNYETFGRVADMPKWRTAHPEVEDYLCRVGEYWLREANIDGWRLDVSDEVEHRFWRHFRDRVKAVRDDALVCGEIWQVATPWLRGDEFDAVMNYPLGRAILDWIARGCADARVFAARVETIRTLYPEPVLHTLWNVVDSHDTPRLLTECGRDVRRAKLASFLQFTLPGSPLLYYGDEYGMEGGGDPLCRGGMMWEHTRQNRDLFDHYRALIALRKDWSALRAGDLRPLSTGKRRQLYAYVRRPKRAAAVACYVNNGRRPVRICMKDRQLPAGTYRVAYGQEAGAVIRTGDTLTVAPVDAVLLVQSD